MSSASGTLMGRLTADPELRYTQNGLPVVNFTVAHNPRALDRSTNEWKDSGDALFMRCTAWRDHAEHVAQLRKGDEVVVIGRLSARNYEDRDGNKRTAVEFEADVVAVDLRRQIASLTRTPRTDAAGSDEWTPERSPALQAVVDRVA